MIRSKLKTIGKIGRRNISANQKLIKLWHEKGLSWCEIMESPECSHYYPEFLTNAHRHKRHWYLRRPELLFDFNQVVRGCVACHNLIENNKELTERVFLRLRGPEVLQMDND